MEGIAIKTSMTKTSNYHYGLCILRMLMCFEVILCHFWIPDGEWTLAPFDWLRPCAVPVFMLMSFYLTLHIYITNDNTKQRKRLGRIAIPQVAWGIIYWIAFSAFSIFDNNIHVSFADMLFQITTGHSEHLNPTMWYQFDLFIITIVLFCCFRFFSFHRAKVLLCILFLASLALQYSHINYYLFGNLIYELKYPLGRIAETLPFAVIGFVLAYKNLLDYKKKKISAMILLTALFVFIVLQFIPILRLSPQFNYGGITLLISSLCVFLLFYSIPPMRKSSTMIQKTILITSKYTLGIYCVHRLVAYILKHVIWRLDITISSFLFCILLYICSFLTCHIISKLPFKIVKQIVN